jgi:hypothetical protein
MPAEGASQDVTLPPEDFWKEIEIKIEVENIP